jgi:hypothetical protein
VNLSAFRNAVGDALDSIPDVTAGDWTVLREPTDAVQPPAFVLVWGPDPWGEPDTSCTDDVQLSVLVVAGRLTIEGNYPIIESMIGAASVALMAARLRPYKWTPPGPFEIGQITYLAARQLIRRPIDHTGGS